MRAFLAGLRTLLRRDRAERDLDDEVRHYLELATQERIEAGMDPERAARAARAAIGGIEATKELVRSGRWETRVESVWRDIKYALRGFRRNPGFTAIVTMTLALGIGANTVMFSVVNAVMLRPLPYRDAHRLVLIYTDDVRRGLHREATAYRTITDWKERNHTFSDIAFYNTQRVSPAKNDSELRGRTRLALVSGNLFEVLGVSPVLGRTISAQDESARAPVVVISYAFWQHWFAGASDVVGRSLVIDDAAKGGMGTLTVIGVMPAEFYFPNNQTDLWSPATTYWRFTRESNERFPEWARRWTAVARLGPGASLASARIDMAHIATELTATFRSDIPDFPGFTAAVIPVLDSIAGADVQSALWILFGATGLVLLVACANVANLLLARGASRQHEFALRRALGGGRGRLIRQLVIEHVAMGLAGGAAGLALAGWSIRLVSTAAAPFVPRIEETSLDLRVLGAATIVSIAAAMLFGAAPALRLSGVDATDALRESGRTHGSLRLRRTRGFMVLAECALAIVLLTAAGLLLRSLNRLLAVDPGFDPHSVLTIRMEFPPEAPAADEHRQASTIGPARARARAQWMEDLTARLRGVPGVQTAGFIDDLYIAGQGHQSITIPARAADQISGELNSGSVTAGFFEALRVPLRRGRYLTRDDTARKIHALWTPVVNDLPLAEKERRAVPEPAVVNDAFAQRFFPGTDPIGQRFCVDPTNKTYWYEIVGVIGDMRRQGLERRAIPEYFGPYFPSPNGRADLLVRTRTEPLALASIIREEVVRSLPSVTIVQVSTADAQLAEFSGRRRLQTWLLSAFAFLALTLAAIGIFGLVHYTVAERTREMGVRVALGATPRDLLGHVLADGMRTPLAGIAIGLAASGALGRVIAHLLFDTRATDIATFGAVAALLAAVAAAACYLAARKAIHMDPLQSLREI